MPRSTGCTQLCAASNGTRDEALRPTLIIQPRRPAVLRHNVRRVREVLTTISPGLVVAILTLVAAVAVTVAILLLAAAGVIVTVAILVIRWRNGRRAQDEAGFPVTTHGYCACRETERMSENTSPEVPQSPDAAQPEAQRNWALKVAEGAFLAGAAAKAGADVIGGIEQGVKHIVKAAADKIHGHGGEPADTGGAPEGKPDAGESP
jgi:hypothetical protein